MVVERAENPNPVGTKLGSEGFWVERMPKEEEKRATGSQFKSEGAGQLCITPTMGWQLTPFVMRHDRIKIGQPPRLPQRIMGPRPIGRDATVRGQVVHWSGPRGSKSQ
jgi:hypothetical protein